MGKSRVLRGSKGKSLKNSTPDDKCNHILHNSSNMSVSSVSDMKKRTDLRNPGDANAEPSLTVKSEVLDVRKYIQTYCVDFAHQQLRTLRVPLARVYNHWKKISPDQLYDIIRRYMSTIGILLGQMACAETFAQFAWAIAGALNSFYNIGGVGVDLSIDTLSSFVQKWFTPLRAQSGDVGRRVISFCKDLRDGATTIGDTELCTKFVTLVKLVLTSTFAVTLGITDKLSGIVDLRVKGLGKSPTTFSLVSYFSNVLLDFVDGSYQYFIEGVPLKFIHNSKSYAAWYAEVIELSAKEHMVTYDEPGPNEIGYEAFSDRLTVAYRQGKEILDQVQQNANMRAEVPAIRRFYSTIAELFVKHVLVPGAGKNRKTPFGALIAGVPGVGKSWVAKAIFRLFHVATNQVVEFDDRQIYTMNAGAAFMDGYQSQNYVLLDDMGKMLPTGGAHPADYANLIEMINTVPFLPNMASLEDKGKTLFQAKAVIATSNLPYAGVEEVFSCPAAALRRLKYRIEVTVKPEYRRQLGDIVTPQMDGFKAATAGVADTGEAYHLILSELRTNREKLIAVQKDSDCDYYPIAEGDFPAIARVLGPLMVKHWEEQTSSVSSMEKVKKLEFCSKCFAPTTTCLCVVEPQSLEAVSVAYLSAVVTCLWWLWWIFVFTINVFFYAFVVGGISTFSFMYLCSVLGITPTTLTGFASKVGVCQNIVMDFAGYYYSVTRVREVLVQAGDRVEKRIAGYHAYLIPVLAATSSLFVLAKVASFAFSELRPQGQASTTLASLCPPYKRREKNVWYKDGHIAVQPHSLSLYSRSSSFEHIVAKAVKCMVFFECPHSGSTIIGFPLGGRDYVFTAHGFPKGDWIVTATKVGSDDGIAPRKTFQVNSKYAFFDYDRDIVLYRDTHLPPVPNFERFLLEDYPAEGSTFDIAMVRGDIGAFSALVVPGLVGKISSVSRSYSAPNSDRTYGAGALQLVYGHEAPDICGSPIFASIGGKAVWLGFHVAGGRGQGVATILSRKWLLSARMSFGENLIPQGPSLGDLDLHSFSHTPGITTEFHYKSIARYVESGHGEVFGELQGVPMGTPHHSVRPSLLFSDVREFYGDSMHRPPDMEIGTTPHGYVNPYQTTLAEITGAEVSIPSDKLEKCAKNFLSRILSAIPLSEIQMMRPLSDSEAVNGVPGLLYVDSINRSAGGGFGMFKSKSAFLVPDPTPDQPDNVKYIPEVEAHIAVLEDRLLYETASPIFLAHMKDEPVSLRVRDPASQFGHSTCDYDCDNFKKKDARVFTGTPAPWSHIVRKYFLMPAALAQSNNIAFECAIGTDATSGDWATYYHYLTAFGSDRIIAGDYKGYDKRLPSELLLYSAYVMIELAKLSPHYSEACLCRMRGVASDIVNPVWSLKGVLVRLYNGSPSGHPLTSLFNSIANSLLIRLAWVDCGNDLEDFSSCVNVLTYGDDNIMGVARNLRFDHTLISHALGAYGLQYTMADKTSQSVPFIQMENADFLKRAFVVRSVQGSDYVFAPLSHSSIVRMLTYTFGTSLDERQHVMQVLPGALREAFQHGEEYYDQFLSFAAMVCEKHCLPTGWIVSYMDMWRTVRSSYEHSSVRFL